MHNIWYHVHNENIARVSLLALKEYDSRYRDKSGCPIPRPHPLMRHEWVGHEAKICMRLNQGNHACLLQVNTAQTFLQT